MVLDVVVESRLYGVSGYIVLPKVNWILFKLVIPSLVTLCSTLPLIVNPDEKSVGLYLNAVPDALTNARIICEIRRPSLKLNENVLFVPFDKGAQYVEYCFK